MDKFENEYDNLFENVDDTESTSTNNSSPLNAEESVSDANEDNLTSSDSEVLDLNSYFDIEESDEQPKTKGKNKKSDKLKKSVGRKILTVAIAVFLVVVIIGCVGAGAIIGYVLMYVDGTMHENLDA